MNCATAGTPWAGPRLGRALNLTPTTGHEKLRIHLPPSDVTLPPDTKSPWRARRFVAETLSEDTAKVSDVVSLLVSEIVTNAVLHARTEVRVSIERGEDTIRVEIADECVSGPNVRHFTRHATTGRGLQLVDELSDRWGSEPREGGKVVWFELSASQG